MEVLVLRGRHVVVQIVHRRRVTADRHEAGVRDVRIEHAGLDLTSRLGTDEFHRAFDGVEQSLLHRGLARHLDVGGIQGAEVYDDAGALVVHPLPHLLDDGVAVDAQIHARIGLVQFLHVLVHGVHEGLALIRLDLFVVLLVGEHSRLPGQRRELDLGDVAETHVLAVQVLDDVVHGVDRDLLGVVQHLRRGHAVGEVVIVAAGHQRGLHGVSDLGIRLLQGNGRHADLAVGDVGIVDVQGDLAGDLGQQQVRIERREGLADVRLLAEHHVAGQGLADAAVVDVAVLVARIVVRGVVRVDAGDVLQAFLLLDLDHLVQRGDDAAGHVFLVAFRHVHQVAVQFVQVLREVFHDGHVTRHAALHIERAAAEHELAGFDIVDDFLGDLHGQELLGQQVRPERLLPEGTVVIHADGVHVADHDDAALGIAFRALQIRDVILPVRLFQIAKHVVLIRMSLEIRHFRIEIVHVLRDFRLSPVARVVDGGDVDHLRGELFDFFERIQIHRVLLQRGPPAARTGRL